jgi:hypothetical protein
MADFTLTRGYFGPRVTGKLGRMRKPQSWSVLPMNDGRIMVQSDKSIGCFDPETGEGRLNTAGSYFPHLSVAAPFTFPRDFVTLAREAMLPRGEETTRGGVTIVNDVQVIR